MIKVIERKERRSFKALPSVYGNYELIIIDASKLLEIVIFCYFQYQGS